jgi:pyruvate/2-oxoglutarate dehydrogenase complex dihydrolipoamide dehydrogenase (E3) component
VASGRRVLRAKMPMQRVGRAREAGETQGFMKALVDADTQRLLGAAILGLNGDEVVHAMLDMMAADQPYTVTRTRDAHPSDGQRTACRRRTCCSSSSRWRSGSLWTT